MTSSWTGRIIMASLLLAGACGPDTPNRPEKTARAREGGHPRSAPPPNAAAETLPALQRARLDYLFEASVLLARAWPWLADGETCLLLLEPSLQWVLNCDEAPSTSFTRVPGRFRGQPIYRHNGSTFNASGRELSTAELLHQTPAAAHVDEPGARGSDLSPHHPWLLLGSLESLTEYHPSFLHSTTDEWLSVAIHEFFHVRQLRVPSFAAQLRAINSRRSDPAPLTELYTNEAAYRKRIRREYALLVAAAHELPEAAHARKALRAWHGLYRQRSAQLNKRSDGLALIDSDRLFTYVEGVARYVESAFLVEPSQHPAQPIPGDPRFHAFARFEGRGYAGMNNRQLDSQYYYAIGFHISVLLDRIDPSWKRCVHLHPGWLIGMVERLVSSPAAAPARLVPDAASCFSPSGRARDLDERSRW